MAIYIMVIYIYNDGWAARFLSAPHGLVIGRLGMARFHKSLRKVDRNEKS